MAKGYKTGGREHGTPNKRTAEVMDSVQRAINLIDGDPDKFQQDIEALTPSERLKFYTNLLEYVRPKLARTDLKHDISLDTRPQIVVETQEQADKLHSFFNRDE